MSSPRSLKCLGLFLALAACGPLEPQEELEVVDEQELQRRRADTTPPEVRVTSPSEGAVVSGSVRLNVSASDVGTGLASVRYLIDGVEVANDLTCCTWDEPFDASRLSPGPHRLVAEAKDKAGNVGRSAAVGFSVSGTTAPTRTVLLGTTAPTLAEADSLETSLGRSFAMYRHFIKHYRGTTRVADPFPQAVATWCRDRGGKTLLLSWNQGDPASWAKIAAGDATEDAYIDQLARDTLPFTTPPAGVAPIDVLINPTHEMTHYGEAHGPTYVAMLKRIIARMRTVNPRLRFVWMPVGYHLVTGSAGSYWPGDAYVSALNSDGDVFYGSYTHFIFLQADASLKREGTYKTPLEWLEGRFGGQATTAYGWLTARGVKVILGAGSIEERMQHPSEGVRYATTPLAQRVPAAKPGDVYYPDLWVPYSPAQPNLKAAFFDGVAAAAEQLPSLVAIVGYHSQIQLDESGYPAGRPWWFDSEVDPVEPRRYRRNKAGASFTAFKRLAHAELMQGTRL